MAKITPDDRVLKRGSLPFFWLGDTCWSAFTNMTDAEWQDYIIKRAAQGFNVVQVNALPQWDRCGSTLGLYPFPTQDGLHFTYDGTLNKAYFARAGRMAALAAHYGITLAVAVQWCNYVPGTWAAAKHPENILPAAMVEPVVKKICETFSAYDPVFLISGDADFETEQALQRYLWVTRLVQKFAPDAPLAYHLKGWSDALPQELAENAALYLYQSGHNPAYQYTAWTLAESFRARLPQKPVLNSEPCYEQMGYSRLAYGRIAAVSFGQACFRVLVRASPTAPTASGTGISPVCRKIPSAARAFCKRPFARTLWGCPAQRISHLPGSYVRVGADGILPPARRCCLPTGRRFPQPAAVCAPCCICPQRRRFRWQIHFLCKKYTL